MVQWQTYQTSIGASWITASNINPWSALVPLQPGTNFFAAQHRPFRKLLRHQESDGVLLHDKFAGAANQSRWRRLDHSRLQRRQFDCWPRLHCPGDSGCGPVVLQLVWHEFVGNVFENQQSADFHHAIQHGLDGQLCDEPVSRCHRNLQRLVLRHQHGVAAESAGLLTGLVTGKMGSYSGTLVLAGARYGLSGGFDVSGNASHPSTAPRPWADRW